MIGVSIDAMFMIDVCLTSLLTKLESAITVPERDPPRSLENCTAIVKWIVEVAKGLDGDGKMCRRSEESGEGSEAFDVVTRRNGT